MTLHYLVTDVDERYAEQLKEALHQEFGIALEAFEIVEDSGRKALSVRHEKLRSSAPFHRIRNYVNGWIAGHRAGRKYEAQNERQVQ